MVAVGVITAVVVTSVDADSVKQVVSQTVVRDNGVHVMTSLHGKEIPLELFRDLAVRVC